MLQTFAQSPGDDVYKQSVTGNLFKHILICLVTICLNKPTICLYIQLSANSHLFKFKQAISTNK